MMGPRTPPLFLTICFLSLAPYAVGFGQRFEPLRGGVFASPMLRCKKDVDPDGPEDVMDFRQRLELTYAVFDGDRDDPMASFVKAENEATEEASSAVALDRLFSADSEADEANEWPCEGEDCDIDSECAIPESFKIVPGADSVDVMAFLGIKRAEPLKAKKEVGEWQ